MDILSYQTTQLYADAVALNIHQFTRKKKHTQKQENCFPKFELNE